MKMARSNPINFQFFTFPFSLSRASVRNLINVSWGVADFCSNAPPLSVSLHSGIKLNTGKKFRWKVLGDKSFEWNWSFSATNDDGEGILGRAFKTERKKVSNFVSAPLNCDRIYFTPLKINEGPEKEKKFKTKQPWQENIVSSFSHYNLFNTSLLP